MTIKIVTVLGANGVMGKNVSAIFASFGGAKVYMMCRTKKQAEQAAEEASMLVRADTIKERLIPVVYENIKECLSVSDLVFESVAENFEIKKEINKVVVQYLGETAVFCTGTSGLSVNKLEEGMSENVAKRYLGIHFYNPPYSMPLCELIVNQKTDDKLVKEIEKYLKEKLFRTVVEVKDSPAFLGNRIGFFFINEAFQYAERYKETGGIDYIDATLGPFTGRNMAPILTSDFVGLDVHKAIVDNIYKNEKDDCSIESFSLPLFLDELLKKGYMGRKTGRGAYAKISDGNGGKKVLVYDINNSQYREKKVYDIPFKTAVLWLLSRGEYKNAWNIITESDSVEANIIRGFLSRYVVYSLSVAQNLSTDIHAADHVMAMGFNWIPPLAVIEAFGGKEKMIEIIRRSDMNHLNLDFGFVENMIKEAPCSTYDFRRFLKAK